MHQRVIIPRQVRVAEFEALRGTQEQSHLNARQALFPAVWTGFGTWASGNRRMHARLPTTKRC